MNQHRPSRCGEYAGWSQHRREGTPPCDPCRIASNEYKRVWRGTAAGRESTRREAKARRDAFEELARRHPFEFRRIYQECKVREAEREKED